MTKLALFAVLALTLLSCICFVLCDENDDIDDVMYHTEGEGIIPKYSSFLSFMDYTFKVIGDYPSETIMVLCIILMPLFGFAAFASYKLMQEADKKKNKDIAKARQKAKKSAKEKKKNKKED